MSDSAVPTPTFRATIAGARLTVTPWHFGLAWAGPQGALIRERGRAGVVIVDLVVTGDSPEDREVIVLTRQGDPLLPDAPAALTEWARQTGHRRIWFDDSIHDLWLEPAPAGQARVCCPVCRAVWVEDCQGFWIAVRANGCFPTSCLACGGQLPQWTSVGPQASLADNRSTAPQRQTASR